MKAIDKVQTDDLNEEQKKLLADFIKKEMMLKIEESVTQNAGQFAEQIKKYLKPENNPEEPEPSIIKK